VSVHSFSKRYTTLPKSGVNKDIAIIEDFPMGIGWAVGGQSPAVASLIQGVNQI
jgi:hypothetical protein